MIQLFRSTDFIHHASSLTNFSKFHHEKRNQRVFFPFLTRFSPARERYWPQGLQKAHQHLSFKSEPSTNVIKVRVILQLARLHNSINNISRPDSRVRCLELTDNLEADCAPSPGLWRNMMEMESVSVSWFEGSDAIVRQKISLRATQDSNYYRTDRARQMKMTL